MISAKEAAMKALEGLYDTEAFMLLSKMVPSLDSEEAVLLGGAIRSARQYLSPRDYDLVVSLKVIKDLYYVLKDLESKITSEGGSVRNNSFGGLKFTYKGKTLDVWCIGEHESFKSAGLDPTWENLPMSTPYNVQAVAVSLGPNPQMIGDTTAFDRAFETKVVSCNYPFKPQAGNSSGVMISVANYILTIDCMGDPWTGDWFWGLGYAYKAGMVDQDREWMRNMWDKKGLNYHPSRVRAVVEGSFERALTRHP